MPVHLAKLQQPTPIWHRPSNLQVWSTCQVDGRTWRLRFRPSFQQSWKAATVSQLQAKQAQPWPTGVRPHWQPSPNPNLKTASQSEFKRQPGFATVEQQSATVVQPYSMLQPSGGYQNVVTGSTDTGPKPHANQFQFSWRLKEGNQPNSRNQL